MPKILIRPPEPKVVHNLPKGKKYKNFTGAQPDIRHDYLVENMKSGEVYRKYLPLCVKSFTFDTLKTWINQSTLAVARRELKADRAVIAKQAKNSLKLKQKRVNAKEASLTAEADKVEALRELTVKREQKAQEKHTRRMSKQADKAFNSIKKIDLEDEDEEMTVRGFVGLLTDYDKLARKIYNMENASTVSPHQLNIAILTGGGQLEAMDDSVNVQVFEAEVTT